MPSQTYVFIYLNNYHIPFFFLVMFIFLFTFLFLALSLFISLYAFSTLYFFLPFIRLSIYLHIYLVTSLCIVASLSLFISLLFISIYIFLSFSIYISINVFLSFSLFFFLSPSHRGKLVDLLPVYVRIVLEMAAVLEPVDGHGQVTWVDHAGELRPLTFLQVGAELKRLDGGRLWITERERETAGWKDGWVCE